MKLVLAIILGVFAFVVMFTALTVCVNVQKLNAIEQKLNSLDYLIRIK